jgi:peptide chain release factor subunit 1
MPKTDQLQNQLDRLTSWDPGPFPVVSLYLNLQANQHGRDEFDRFLRKEIDSRLLTYPADAPERASLTADAERIRDYVGQAPASANGLALFTCSGAQLFEAVVLEAPIDDHQLHVSSEPHLYPLAKVLDEYPRYAVLLADTNRARLFVFAANAVQDQRVIENVKTRRHSMGGWSQARFQRHIEHFHVQHAKEAVETLARVVRGEQIRSVVLAGDEVIVPLLREQLPKDVAERVVDVVRLDIRASDRDVLERTIATMREKDVENDRASVEALFDAYRSGGLGVVGVEAVRRALEAGQVDELLISATPAAIAARDASSQESNAPDRSDSERVADELIVKARQTAASIRFIEDLSLLDPVGGVGALLRFRM